MKLTVLLLLISACAFAQQKVEPVKMDLYDSLDLEFDWKKEVFRQWDCICPLYSSPDGVRQLRPEFNPYQYVDKNKPIIIDDSTYQEWIKSEQEFQKFKKSYLRADSLMRVRQDSIRVIKKKPVIL